MEVSKLEKTHNEDISKLNRRMDELSRQISDLERTLNKIIMNSETYLAAGSEYNKNLDDLTRSMHQLQISLARSPAQYNAFIEEALQPIYDKLNEHSAKFFECGEQVKEDIKNSTKSKAALIWVAIVTFSSVIVYAYNSDRTYVIDKLDTLKQLENKLEDKIDSIFIDLESRIDKHHPYYYTSKENKDKDKVDKK